MLVGYNTNVPYKGTLYHIQTEDSGLKNPVITTLLYVKGTILSSKKVNYAHLASQPDYKEKVRELMKEQHKAMMKELISGKHTGDAAESQQDAQPSAEKADPEPEEVKAASPPPPLPPPPPPDEVREPSARSLDDILLDFIISEGEKSS